MLLRGVEGAAPYNPVGKSYAIHIEAEKTAFYVATKERV